MGICEKGAFGFFLIFTSIQYNRDFFKFDVTKVAAFKQ